MRNVYYLDRKQHQVITCNGCGKVMSGVKPSGAKLGYVVESEDNCWNCRDDELKRQYLAREAFELNAKANAAMNCLAGLTAEENPRIEHVETIVPLGGIDMGILGAPFKPDYRGFAALEEHERLEK